MIRCMNDKKIGALTIGQSPRVDAIPEMEPFLNGVEIMQAGALDGLNEAEINALAPDGGGDILVSRLRDGSWVTMEEAKLIPLLQEKVDLLCAQGVNLLLMMCTGKFPNVLRAKVPIVYPQRLLYGVVPAIAGDSCIGVVTPDKKQLEQSLRNWKAVASNVVAVCGNPYDLNTDWTQIGRELVRKQVEWIVLDCIGYNRQIKDFLQRYTRKPVILPRTLLARVVGEML